MHLCQVRRQLTTWGRLVIFGVAVLGAGATASEAQEGKPANARALGFGMGVGTASMSVGDSRNSVVGASILGRIGIDSRNRFLLIAEFNPAQVTNPVMDESFSAVNVLLGFGIGKSFKVRPSLGMQFRSWSGEERVTDSDATLLVGLDIGPEFRLSPRFSLSPELVFRYSLIELESSVGSRFIGLQLVGSWRLAGH